jgi:hypothetical protein
VNTSRLIRPLIAAALLAGVACGNGTGTGTLAIRLVDAPTDSVKSIFVTIDSVTAHSDEAGWVNVFQGPLTVDLLTLKETSMQLGQVTLPAGTVSQVRFVLVDSGPQYVVLDDGSQAPLKVPSGSESGVKLNGPFTVSACNKHTLVLDFDGMHSIEYHETGSDLGWILRPVIHVKAEADEVEPCNPDGGSPDAGSPDAGPTSPTDGGIQQPN